MDSKDKWRLRSNRRSLMDIDASMICMRLISVGIITSDDSERICSGATHEDKAEALLNMLETKGEGAYKAFVKALSQDYLVLKLDQTDFSKMPEDLKDEASSGASGSASGSDTIDWAPGVTGKMPKNLKDKSPSAGATINVRGNNNVILENCPVSITNVKS